MNFVRYLADQSEIGTRVFTTRKENQTFRADIPERVEIHVTILSGNQFGSRIIRALKYLQFSVMTIFRLLRRRSDVVVYFDPYSAMPGILYHLLTNRKRKLWIHFHEYFRPEWYAKGMLMVRAAHSLEKRFVFKTALGISHTNPDRARFFLDDNPAIDKTKVFSFPNYPPSQWEKHHRKIGNHTHPIRIVALGSFTLKSTYLAEICQWVESHNGDVELDIYSLYYDEETKAFLQNLDHRWIRFHSKGILYDKIPIQFSQSKFHVGLVLYKCKSLNSIYCASNKLFEYLACGLDVWYPTEMVGTKPYVTEGVYPKVLPVDFQCLKSLDLDSLLAREGHRYLRGKFFCEPVYSSWVSKLIGKQ